MEGITLLEMLHQRKPEKAEKIVRAYNHRYNLTEGLSSMFVRKGYPNVDALEFAEQWLIEFGAIGYIANPSDLVRSWKTANYRCGWVTFGGDPYPSGIGSTAFIHGEDGFVREYKDWKNNADIVVAFNNLTYLPDLNIIWTSDFLTEYDISLKYQIKYSRLKPIPVVNDDKEKLAVDTILDNIDDGKFKSILSKNLLSELTGEGSKGIQLVELSDPKASDHIQYLDHGRDDIMRWFWSQYGMDAAGASKLAQETVDEVNNGLELSMVIPHSRYHMRQKEAEDLKKVFGWDVTIEFSEPWQNRLARCKNESEEVTVDGSADSNGDRTDTGNKSIT